VADAFRGDPLDVHAVRKQVKRIRALLRLARCSLERAEYRSLNDGYRDIGRRLAAARDAQVRVTTVTELLERSRSLPRRGRDALARRLERERDQTVGRTTRRITPDDVKAMDELAARLAGLSLRRPGWNAVESSLCRTYYEGKRLFRTARAETTPQTLHEWRKRVKDLAVQLEILGVRGDSPVFALRTRLERLGEVLGDDHDLHLVTEAAAPAGPDRDRVERAVQQRIESWHRRLRAEAFALGESVFSSTRSTFRDAARRHWKAYHQERRAVRTNRGPR
jgi:CHAD domain-containing protein